jgi:serine/threonine-protein kinase
MTRHVGRYEIIEELGRGDMGIVYKAKDPLIDRLIAIKVIRLDGLTRDARKEYEARFYQEARAAGRLNHPNIVTIHDVGGDGDSAYIAMEFLEGQELQGIIKRTQLALDETLDIAIQVASGLAFAGRNGVVHRDIKPSNLVMMADHRIKIVDFGVARDASRRAITGTGAMLGTPKYMSPEHLDAGTAGPPSDIYSLGAVAYELLAGQAPYHGDPWVIVSKILMGHMVPLSVANPRVPAGLVEVVTRMLASEASARYANAIAVVDALRTAGF